MTNSAIQLTGQQFADRIGYELSVLQSQTQASRWNLGTVEKDEIVQPQKIKAIIERVVSIKRGDAQERVQKANALHIELFGTPARVVNDVPSASAPSPQFQEQLKIEWAKRVKTLKAEHAAEMDKAIADAVEKALVEQKTAFDAVVKSEVADAVAVQVKAIEEKHKLQADAIIGNAKGDMSKDLADIVEKKVTAARQEIHGTYKEQIAELKADKKRLEDAAVKAAEKFDGERRFLTGDTKIADKDAEIADLTRQIAQNTEGVAQQIADKDAEIADLTRQIDEMAARLAVKWYQKISQFDVVNILSNGVALFDITNLLKFHPMSFPIALALVLAFWGALKTLKKAESLFGAIAGMIGIIAIECVYGFVFTIFLKDVLHNRENLGEGITPNAVAFYASCIFAAASIFAASMTLLKTIDIVRNAAKKAAKTDTAAQPISITSNPVTT